MIDTLSMAENLTAAGVEQKQAKAIAQAIGEQHGETASKQDIGALKENMDTRFAASKQDIDALKENMDTRFAASKQDIDALKENMDTRFAALKQDIDVLKESMNALKDSMNAQKESMNAQFAAIRWIVGAQAALTLVLLAAFLTG